MQVSDYHTTFGKNTLSIFVETESAVYTHTFDLFSFFMFVATWKGYKVDKDNMKIIIPISEMIRNCLSFDEYEKYVIQSGNKKDFQCILQEFVESFEEGSIDWQHYEDIDHSDFAEESYGVFLRENRV